MQAMPLWEKNVPLWDASVDQEAPTLTPYLLDDVQPHGAVIVCPGGAYAFKAPHEAEPIAKKMNEAGFHAFVLQYRVTPYHWPAPLLDAQRAIRLVRYHAARFGVKPDHIAILGFSAGGHLTAMAGVQYDAGDPGAPDPVDRVSCRPDAFVPCYAVVSMNLFRHSGSARNLTGLDELPLAMAHALSAETRVTQDTPPCFIWHTVQDSSVPVENSLRLAAALGEKDVPYALHIFPYGSHGIGLGEDNLQARQWPHLLKLFLQELGF